jgi:sec-independent protein translocase protein TatC
MIIISKIGLIKVDFFKKHRKILYVFSLFVSALFTPPDPFTMIAMGIPLILLYEFGIFMSSFFLKFGKKEKIDD